MIGKIREKEEAIKLRKTGLAITEISNVLNVAKSSVSLWVRNVQITKEQKVKLKIRRLPKRVKGTLSNKRKNMGEEKWKIYQEVKKKNKSISDYRKNISNSINYRKERKLKLIVYKGGKCEICGYDKLCPTAYDFHHVDPTEKAFSVSRKSLSLESLKKEVDKCQLLCCRCHAEINYAIYEKTKQQTLEKWSVR